MDDPNKRRRKFFDEFEDEDFPSLFDGDFHQRIHEHIERIMHDAFRHIDDLDREQARNYIYGFSMHTGEDGKPVFEEFGNVPRPGTQHIPGEREPLVDVIGGREDVTVIAELPGVDRKDIELDADLRGLTIDVDAAGRKYHKLIRLPAEVDPDTVQASYKNGVLEVKIKRKKKRAPVKRKITVE